jgi:hypothetical protein
MKKIAIVLTVFTLVGCAHNLQLMERGTGRVYAGTSSGMDSGSVNITIDDKSYAGNYVKTGSTNSFGFAQVYGSNGSSATGYMQSYGGTNMFKAILSAPGGHGLRCDLTSDGAGHGGGICVDERERVYDVIFQ